VLRASSAVHQVVSADALVSLSDLEPIEFVFKSCKTLTWVGCNLNNDNEGMTSDHCEV
jgi:hypothetical protein